MPAPICLFTYNRLSETHQTVEALKQNYLAPESELVIFSDGPKNENSLPKVEAVRQYLYSISGFKSVKIIESQENKGLADSIIYGVSQIVEKYGKVIVMEDDLISSPNFLSFMNQALDFYIHDKNIQSINGYSLSLKDKSNEVYFQIRPFSWGWATWNDRWNTKIFDRKNLKTAIESNPYLLKAFKLKCGSDIPKMLLNSIDNINDSWYVRWAFDHFRNNRYSVSPAYSFITNIGYSTEATHCKGINTYTSEPVNHLKIVFDFLDFQSPDAKSSREFLYYFSWRYKISLRIKLLKSKTGRNQILQEIKTRTSKNNMSKHLYNKSEII